MFMKLSDILWWTSQLTICTERYLELPDKDKPAHNLPVKLILYVLYTYRQGRTYPLGKGRRLPRAPKSQGPPKMLFIYEMCIKRGHENGVYYHDNRLRVRVERASCVSCL